MYVTKQRTEIFSFGSERIEVLAAFSNAIFSVFAALFLCGEAIAHYFAPLEERCVICWNCFWVVSLYSVLGMLFKHPSQHLFLLESIRFAIAMAGVFLFFRTAFWYYAFQGVRFCLCMSFNCMSIQH